MTKKSVCYFIIL